MFYRKTVLDNGVTVMSEPMDEVRSIALGIWFAVGSRDESSRRGRHVPLHGAHDVQGDAGALVAARSPRRSTGSAPSSTRSPPRSTPATTAGSSTSTCPPRSRSCRTWSVNASLDDEACQSERQVVIEEIARTEDAPDDHIHDIFSETLWPDHPIGLPILGTRDIGGRVRPRPVGRVPGSALPDRQRRGRGCGQRRSRRARRARRRSRFACRTARARSGPSRRRPPRRSIAVMNKETEQAHICYGVSTLNAHHPDRFALNILDGVLGGGMSSRLFQEIREKRGLAYAVYSFTALYQDTGEFGVYAGTRPENAEEVIRLIQNEVEKIADQGVTAEELDRVRQAAKGHLVLGMESTRNRMTRLGKNEVTGGEILSADEIMERFNAVTMDDLKRVSGEVLSDDKVLAVIGPFEPASLEHLVDSARASRGEARRMIRVLVAGAAGKVGHEVVKAVTAAEGMDVVSAVDVPTRARRSTTAPAARSRSRARSPRRSRHIRPT